jgi:hypothetical protein
MSLCYRPLHGVVKYVLRPDTVISTFVFSTKKQSQEKTSSSKTWIPVCLRQRFHNHFQTLAATNLIHMRGKGYQSPPKHSIETAE